MKTLYLIEPGRLELRDVTTPNPSMGELLIKVHTALTCGTDLKAYRRGHPMIPMPGPFGHEFSGIVEETGGMTGFNVGDEIMAVHSAPCGACVYCKRGLFNQCETLMDTKFLGAFAEYALLPERIVRQNVFIKPPHLSFASAALLEPLSCVVHGISPLNVQKDCKAVVIGCGAIALLHMLVLRQKGAWVIAACRRQEKLTTARTFGADETLLISDDQRVSHYEGVRADLVFECTGDPVVWQKSPHFAERGATVVLFGGCKKGAIAGFDTYRLHYHEITLKGCFHFTPKDVKEAYNLLSNGLSVEGLITDTLSLDKAGDAFRRLDEGKGIKYALIP